MTPTSLDLRALANEAARNGWAAGTASLIGVRLAAGRLGWEPVELRTGDGGATVLVPVTPQQAPVRSHSATVGTGQQPLHTDGAHRRRPPRWIVLHTARPSATATRLCRLRRSLHASGDGAALPADAAEGGVFLVDSGADRFLATLYTSRLGWRWDPGCMTPCDQRAREAATFLSGLSDEAADHTWSESNQFLLIDNAQTLHARSDAAGDDGRQLTRLAFGADGES